MKLNELFQAYQDFRRQFQNRGLIDLAIPDPEEQPLREQIKPEITEEDLYLQRFEQEYPWLRDQPKPVDQQGNYLTPNSMGYSPGSRYFRGIPQIEDLNSNMWGFPWPKKNRRYSL